MLPEAEEKHLKMATPAHTSCLRGSGGARLCQAVTGPGGRTPSLWAGSPTRAGCQGPPFSFASQKQAVSAAVAKVEEGPGGCASLQDELSCPICLCLYRNPVSLTCGHSFCKQCIQKALGTQQQFKAPYSCPMCKLQLGPILELQKNFQLSSIVEAFLATSSQGQQGRGAAEGEKEVVPCDFCLDWGQPAVKTCLICDASLCQAHLNRHNAKAPQRDHVVVEVGAGGAAEERRCPEHGQLLECYCQDEGEYICVLCCITGGHKGHGVVTLKEVHSKQLGELSDTVTWLQERKSALAIALEELQRSENQVKTNTKAVTSQVQKLFEGMKTELIQKEKKILSDIQSNEKKQLADITKVKQKMEQRRDEAAQHLQSLQTMREQPDIFLFLKEFKLDSDRIASQNFSVSKVNVVGALLDQSWIDHYQCLMWKFMSRLASLQKDVQSALINQIIWNSGASDTATSSNSDNGGRAQEACGAAQKDQEIDMNTEYSLYMLRNKGEMRKKNQDEKKKWNIVKNIWY